MAEFKVVPRPRSPGLHEVSCRAGGHDHHDSLAPHDGKVQEVTGVARLGRGRRVDGYLGGRRSAPETVAALLLTTADPVTNASRVFAGP